MTTRTIDKTAIAALFGGILSVAACGGDSAPAQETPDAAGLPDGIDQTANLMDVTGETPIAVEGAVVTMRRVPGDGCVGHLCPPTDAGLILEMEADLTPGNVYSVYWAFFNSPENCTTSPEAAEGEPKCGMDDLTEELAETVASHWAYAGPPPNGGAVANATTGNWYVFAIYEEHSHDFVLNENIDSGLINSLDAEVHVIVRNHGPALEGEALTAQMSDYEGGCGENTCADEFHAVFLPVVE